MSECLPERLSFIQEMHLVLHAGAGLQLLDHHLSGLKAFVHLPQQNLERYRQRRICTTKTDRWTQTKQLAWSGQKDVSWCRQTHGDGHTRSRYTKVDGLVFTSMKERRSRQGNRGWRGGITTICYLAVKAQSDITGIAAAKLDPSKDQQPGPRPHWVSSTWQVRSVTGGLTFPNQPFPISFR